MRKNRAFANYSDDIKYINETDQYDNLTYRISKLSWFNIISCTCRNCKESQITNISIYIKNIDINYGKVTITGELFTV